MPSRNPKLLLVLYSLAGTVVSTVCNREIIGVSDDPVGLNANWSVK